MNQDQVISYLSGYLKNKVDHFDGILLQSETQDIEIYDAQISKSEISDSQGVGIRVLKDRCPGYAYTESLTKASLLQMMEDAISHAKLTGELDIDLPEVEALPSIDLEKYHTSLDQLSMQRMKEYCLEMEQKLKESDRRIINIPHVGMGKGMGETWIFNSKGVCLSSKSARVSAYLGAVAEEKGQKKSGGYSFGSRSVVDFDTDKMSNFAKERSVELLGAKPVPSGVYPVVLSNRVSANLFGMFTSIFSADIVQKGQSKFKGKLEQKVAQDQLQLICDPHIKQAPGSRLYDGEGIPCKVTPLIENGVLKNYMYNLETAKKEGRRSSGHGSRGIQGKVGTSYSNLRVPLGEHSLSTLLKYYPKCLYIVKLEGSSACSAVSGDISIGVQGFYVEAGSIVHAVDANIMNSNFFDLLMSIESISNEYSDSFSSVKIPDLLISEVHISG